MKKKLIFEDGSVAKIRSATNLSSESDVTISDGEMTIYVNQPWHCGEFSGRKSQIKIVNANSKEELIDIKTDKGIYALEIDHFAEAFFNEELESTLLPHNDSHGNMIALDQWRRELKVVYDDDRGEKRKVSVISRKEFELVCNLHRTYYKHNLSNPCTCNPKQINQWIADLNKIWENYLLGMKLKFHQLIRN